MKALVLSAIKTPLSLEERDDPQPGPGEVVVKLQAAALNRRDFWITRGLYPGIRPPVVLGSDGCGIVAEVGDGVDDAWCGREVVIDPGLDWGDDPRVQGAGFRILGLPDDGTFATHVVVPATQLHAKPDHLDAATAAALPLATLTAYRAVFTQGGLQSGERMLITGVGGGVAVAALQLGVAAGAEVIVTSSSEEKIARAVKLGALGGVSYTADDWARQLRSAAEAGIRKGHGHVDLTIDGAGGDGYGPLLELAAPGGRVVSYGATAGPPERVDLFKVFWKQLHLIGSTMGSPADFTAMLDFVDKHRITPVVDEVLSLEDGNEAVEKMKTSPQFGKIVLRV